MLDLFWLLWPVLLVAGMIYAAMTLLQQLGGRSATPYTSRPKLVTNTELHFYHVLKEAVDDDWAIFAMVRIADILRVPKGIKNRRSWLNKILSKHIDFVLCDHETLEFVAAIELDDPSHERLDRIQRDQFVNAAFHDADLPLLRIPTDDEYDAHDIRKMIERAI